MSHAPYIVRTAPQQWRVMIYEWPQSLWSDRGLTYRTRAEARASLPWVRHCRVCGSLHAACGGPRAAH